MKKKRSKPKALLSKQWQSESTLSARAADAPDPADNSPSPTDAPEPCKGAGKAPKSVLWIEQPVVHSPDPPPGGLAGSTQWTIGPTLTASAFCDGPAKQYVGRVTTATGQQTIKIAPGNGHPTAAEIVAAVGKPYPENCGRLFAMWNGIKASLTDPDPGNGWAPRDLIVAHENVHKAISSDNAQKFADAFKGAVEGLSAACKDGDASVVKGIEDAHKKYQHEFFAAERENKDHKPQAPFLAATRAIARSWLAAIRLGMEQAGCEKIPPLPPP